MWFVENGKLSSTDINFYNSGEEQCPKGYSFGPAVRPHYIIHYILSGKGFFRYGKKQYDLKAGNGFLICPDNVTYYEADKEDPWNYIWVGFNGIKVPKIIRQTGLRQDNPIFFYDTDSFFEDTIKNIASYNNYSLEAELCRDAYLYLFLSKLISIAPKDSNISNYNSNTEEYIKCSIDYIEKNYACNISVTELANYIGINRTYLCAIFKKATGQTPIEYIVKTRIEKACNLLKNENLSISAVSNSVGYVDQFVFSKQFKSIMSESPSQYRKMHECL